jgi:hypothetical protein
MGQRVRCLAKNVAIVSQNNNFDSPPTYLHKSSLELLKRKQNGKAELNILEFNGTQNLQIKTEESSNLE